MISEEDFAKLNKQYARASVWAWLFTISVVIMVGTLIWHELTGTVSGSYDGRTLFLILFDSLLMIMCWMHWYHLRTKKDIFEALSLS